MVRIRLTRAGAKKAPFYRIVVTDHRSPRGGKFLETIGTFDPLRKEGQFEIKRDRLDFWKSKGAQLSDTVVAVLKKNPPVAPVAS
jgi:small subunit ribosomal protein S16